MKVLEFGSGGFVGQSVCEVLQAEHEVHTATRSDPVSVNNHPVDLLDVAAVQELIETVAPDAIVNCAGVVSGEDVSNNEVFTKNILYALVTSKHPVKKIVICGSAGVYGFVAPDELPVKETQPLRAESEYGVSKIAEEKTAMQYKKEYNLPITIARIFNPLGTGMQPRFITSRIVEQIKQIKSGSKDKIQLSRLDAERDYIGVHDVALAIKALMVMSGGDSVYNVGSGRAITNGYIARKLAEYSGLGEDVRIEQTVDTPEHTVASQADISKIQNDTGWKPVESIDNVLKGIADA